jgi:hypothetical protein
MPIFKLANVEDNIDRSILIPATKTNLELEKHLLRGFGGATWGVLRGAEYEEAGRVPGQMIERPIPSASAGSSPLLPTNCTLIFKSSRQVTPPRRGQHTA